MGRKTVSVEHRRKRLVLYVTDAERKIVLVHLENHRAASKDFEERWKDKGKDESTA